MLADVIQREAFEFWDDETFVGYADELRQAASDVAAAAAADNYDAGPRRDRPRDESVCKLPRRLSRLDSLERDYASIQLNRHQHRCVLRLL